MINKSNPIKILQEIPGVGPSIAANLIGIGINSPADLENQSPEVLYERLNQKTGTRQDPCVLYVFRCAVYYASTPQEKHDPELLKWWNWKDRVINPHPPSVIADSRS